MIVTCPSCATRYLVETEKLGAQGRMVRCGNCAHTWHQTPPDTPVVELMVPEPTPLGPGEKRGLPAIPEKKRTRGKLVAFLILLLLLAGAGWGAVFLRDTIMAWVPQTARYYAKLGLDEPKPQAGPGLELRNVTPTRGFENGLPALLINGQVVNLSSSTRKVPRLKVVLRDSHDQELTSWSFDPGIGQLGPGGAAPFHTVLTQPSELATGVVVTFETQ
jgi:predicted Zn finger-like uncharacterized protein